MKYSYPFFSVFMFLLFNNLYGQTDYIKVHALSSRFYEIRNESEFYLKVTLTGTKYDPNAKEEFVMIPLTKKYFVANEKESYFNMEVRYEEAYYLKRKKVLDDHIKSFGVSELDLDSIYRQVIDGTGKLHDYDLINDEDYLKATVIEIITYLVISESLRRKIEPYVDKLIANKLAYSGSQQENLSEYRRNFQKRSIRSEVLYGYNSKRSIIGNFSLTSSALLIKSEIGDDWKNLGTLISPLTFSHSITPEFRLGRKLIFGKFFVGLSYLRDGYSLRNDNEFFFVSKDYVENPSEEFYRLEADKSTHVIFQISSVNLWLRTVFYPKFHIDLGGGYNFYRSGSLNFARVSSTGSLSGNIEGGDLRESPIKKIISSEEGKDNLHGILRLGYNLSLNEWGMPIQGLTLFLQSNMYKRNFSVTDNYEIYHANSNQLLSESVSYDELPLLNDSYKWRYSFQLGVSITF